MSGDRRRVRRERGSVTAEMAVLLPAVLLILVALASIAALGTAQVRVQQAAASAAREFARGNGENVDISSVAGSGASLESTVEGSWTRVTVRRPVPLLGIIGPSLTVEAESTARSEIAEGAS